MNKDSFFKDEKSMRFIPFITAGDPTPDVTIDMALMLQDLGADAIELGIPYSDPLADGPIIQRASIRAIEQGMTLEKAMALVPKMKEKGLNIPVIIFTYYNLLLQLGENKFLERANELKIDGLLVPDLPYEESYSLRESCERYHVVYISLVAPTTSEKRLSMIGNDAKGFLYCVSSLGVTGVRQQFHDKVFNFLDRVRKVSVVPIAVGFGISSYKQVEALEKYCDGFIVGSAIVKEIESRYQELLSESTKEKAVQEIKQVLSSQLFNPCEVS